MFKWGAPGAAQGRSYRAGRAFGVRPALVWDWTHARYGADSLGNGAFGS